MTSAQPSQTPQWRGRQFHYLSSESHVHPFLAGLWQGVHKASGGRLKVTVHAANEGLVRSHLGIVQQLIEGEIEFYLLTGGVLAPLLPAMTMQGLPFAFSNPAQVHAAFDGVLGDYLREALEPEGVVAVPFGLLENGFRHVFTVDTPVNRVEDLAGLRIRIPEDPMIEDAFRSLGAEPVPVFVLDLHRALLERRIDAQENSLAVTEALNLHEVTRCVSLTSHMWSGFNLLASRKFWKGLPEDIREIILKNVKRHVARQRAHSTELNRELEARLAVRGMTILHPEPAGFRARLMESGFYGRWQEIIGRKAWSLLEQSVGPIG
jgi:TRAP-type transport system periplasmic protein